MTTTVAPVAVLGALAVAFAVPAQADVINFTGNLTARGVVAADPACAPRFRGTVNPATTVGTSNFGAFTYSHSNCTPGATGGPIDGIFTINFGSDGFSGIFSGLVTPTSQPPVADLDLLYTIQSGTGRFLGATGTFKGLGVADPRVRPSLLTFAFDGRINAPAVPEPATWAMLVLGFGALGAAMRRRTARLAFA